MLIVRRNNDNWMSNLFNDFVEDRYMSRMNATAPAVNIKENRVKYEMEIAAPGLKKEDWNISLDEDGNLHVKMEKKQEHKEEDEKQVYLRREFNYTSYEQTYTLPEDVNKEKIAAKVVDGVLHIELPKKTQEEALQNKRSINID